MPEKKEMKYVRWFSELGKGDVQLVGGKGANLAEMIRINIPVPNGFVITSEAYSYFLKKTGLDKEIYEKLKGLKEEETESLEKASKEIRERIEKEEIPDDLKKEILDAYDNFNIPLDNIQGTALEILKRGRDDVFVAVRSSATAEDSSTASFAGQQETFLNVKGKTNLIEHIKRCFSSLFTPRSIYYRIKKGFQHEQVLNAVVVQKMVNSDKSGVIFTINPVTQEEEVNIESVFGLGEGIVSGKIKPDKYVVDKKLEIKEKKIANKKIAITRNSAGNNETVELTKDRSEQQVLEEQEIKKLAEYSIKIEKHYKAPQDIEFAVENKEIFIVQTRPITTLEKKEMQEIKGKSLLTGLAASPGIGSGKVKVIHDLNELGKIVKGDILVTEMTNPDMVVSMQKADAIVTDEGGLTSHAAIVSREMGIPAVVGTEKATKVLKDGQIVSVDGFKGKVYEGELEEKEAEIEKAIETKIKLKLIVDLPDYAERASKTGLKDIGLIRLEGIIAKMKKHPLWYYKNNKLDEYSELIFEGLRKIMKYFDSAWIRSSDLRTDEFSQLESSPEKEGNPMLGDHGARFSIQKPEILKAELKAISKINNEIGVMFPQVISIEEVKKLKKIFDEICKEENKKFGVMIETPASVQIIDDICKEVDFISIGSNDLTQYTLAVDRNNEDVQELYDEMHPAVLSQIAKVLESCKKNNTESSICGQAGSKEEMVKFLLKHGINSISVNADKAKEISELVAGIENKEEIQDEVGEKEEIVEENDNKEDQDAEQRDEEVEVGDETGEDRQELTDVNQKVEEEEKEEFPDVEIGFDVFGGGTSDLKRDKAQEEELEEEIEEEKKETEMRIEEKLDEEKKEQEKELEENIKGENKKVEEEEKEEYPDTEIGFDVFSNVGKNLEKAERVVEEKAEETEKEESDEEREGDADGEDETDEEEVEEQWNESVREVEEEEKQKQDEDILDIF